jgi:DNA-binding transcriptional ArsR family regulator
MEIGREIEWAIRALAALGQCQRLSVFRLLVEAGPDGRTPGEIADGLGMPATTLSFHLKTLVAAGLIGGTARGRSIRYRVDFAAMHALIGFLTQDCCGGDAALCAPAVADCAAGALEAPCAVVPVPSTSARVSSA